MGAEARTGRNAPLLRSHTIADALRRSAAKFRDRLALTYLDRRWSFRDLEQAAGRIAHALSARGLKKGDRVAAYARNSDAYILL